MKQYLNHHHYINEGWSKQPKKIFTDLISLIEAEHLGNSKQYEFLDIGCATGELIYYLKQKFKSSNFTGLDVSEDLIYDAQKLQPEVSFEKASILNLPQKFKDKFDVVTVIGVLSIFDEEDLDKCLDNILSVTKKNGKIFILSPFNEFGVDAIIRHRKRVSHKKGAWESGWNIYSLETIHEILHDKCTDISVTPFKVDFEIQAREDAIRTWTMSTENNPFQLTNGLKLLINHYFICLTK